MSHSHTSSSPAASAEMRQSRLCRLGQMPRHRIAPGECEIRGWLVVADDGRRVGRVHDVIVDFLTLRLRYIETMLDVQLSEDDTSRLVVVPIACARVSAHRRQVNLSGVGAGDIVHAPRYGSAPLPPEAEAALRQFFLRPKLDALPLEGDGITLDAWEEARFWGLRRKGRERESYLRALELQ